MYIIAKISWLVAALVLCVALPWYCYSIWGTFGMAAGLYLSGSIIKCSLRVRTWAYNWARNRLPQDTPA